jgi:hypothetical protein
MGRKALTRGADHKYNLIMKKHILLLVGLLSICNVRAQDFLTSEQQATLETIDIAASAPPVKSAAAKAMLAQIADLETKIAQKMPPLLASPEFKTFHSIHSEALQAYADKRRIYQTEVNGLSPCYFAATCAREQMVFAKIAALNALGMRLNPAYRGAGYIEIPAGATLADVPFLTLKTFLTDLVDGNDGAKTGHGLRIYDMSSLIAVLRTEPSADAVREAFAAGRGELAGRLSALEGLTPDAMRLQIDGQRKLLAAIYEIKN